MYDRTRDCIGGISKAEGAAGFFTGYVATVMREMPFSAIQFPLYEGMKLVWAR
jgi:solute carrier family 25 S-adenosylmethionine transporter 26